MEIPANSQAVARYGWWAIAVGTIILNLSYWAMVFAFVASEADDGPNPGPPFAFGLMLIPFVFVALAAISRNPRFGGASVLAMLLSVGVGVPVLAVARDAVSGIIAGFGAGGVVALRREPVHRVQSRIWAVVLVSTATLAFVRLIPVMAIILAPIAILPAIGVADILQESSNRTSDPGDQAASR